MTAKEAFKAVPDKFRYEIGDNYFVLLKWSGMGLGDGSFENSKEGPLLVSVDGDVAIEIGMDGKFKKSFPAAADGYYPFLPGNDRMRKDALRALIKQLFEQIA